MTKCENCYHSDVCADYNKTHSIDWEPDCKYLKDKSLIVELPCKIGDTVYIIVASPCKIGDALCISNRIIYACTTPEVNRYEITEEKICKICIEESEIKIKSKRLARGVSDFGKTVFFTREDAEKALNAQNAV